MRQNWVFTGTAIYRLDDDEDHDILEWLVEKHAHEAKEPARCLSMQDVLARVGSAALPQDFPSPDVIVGSGKNGMRGWLEITVAAWESGRAGPSERGASAAAAGENSEPEALPEPESAPAPVSAKPKADSPDIREPWWSGVPQRADALVAIVTSRGVVKPSGEPASRGPLTDATDLAKLVWYLWPRPPAKTAIPQIWLTGPALRAAGMTPPKGTLKSSEDLSKTVSQLFGCTVTSAQAGWFLAAFPPAGGTGEARRVHLVLLPFLWTDPADSRPLDRGMAGTDGAVTELSDDEFVAVETLAGRIAWLAELADTNAKAKGEPPLLPARRPGAVGAALLDKVRRRETTAHRIEPCPIPTRVYTENGGRLETAVDWRQPHPSKKAKGDSIDVEVDQRAAYLASASVVYLGYGGEPEEFTSIDAASQFGKDASGRDIQPAFGLWNITTPAGSDMEGLDPRLPLPLPEMRWDEPATFWCTTRSVQQLIAPVTDGGGGLVAGQLSIGRAFLWPSTWRCLRAWSEIIRVELKSAIDSGDKYREDFLKNVYKSFLGGRLDSSAHPPGQRHYQQPAWAATIRADTRWRALRYAHRIVGEHGLYPLSGRDIDTWVYRIPPELDPTVLDDDSAANGKYRIKKTSGGN